MKENAENLALKSEEFAEFRESSPVVEENHQEADDSDEFAKFRKSTPVVEGNHHESDETDEFAKFRTNIPVLQEKQPESDEELNHRPYQRFIPSTAPLKPQPIVLPKSQRPKLPEGYFYSDDSELDSNYSYEYVTDSEAEATSETDYEPIQVNEENGYILTDPQKETLFYDLANCKFNQIQKEADRDKIIEQELPEELNTDKVKTMPYSIKKMIEGEFQTWEWSEKFMVMPQIDEDEEPETEEEESSSSDGSENSSIENEPAAVKKSSTTIYYQDRNASNVSHIPPRTYYIKSEDESDDNSDDDIMWVRGRPIKIEKDRAKTPPMENSPENDSDGSSSSGEFEMVMGRPRKIHR